MTRGRLLCASKPSAGDNAFCRDLIDHHKTIPLIGRLLRFVFGAALILLASSDVKAVRLLLALQGEYVWAMSISYAFDSGIHFLFVYIYIILGIRFHTVHADKNADDETTFPNLYF